MTHSSVRFNYEDYKLLPEDCRYEILKGQLLVTPTPNTGHQRILIRLVLAVGNFVESTRVGQVFAAPTDVILDAETVVQPDLLFIAEERSGIADPDGGVHGAPDLVVEVLSPSTAERDRTVKRKLYGVFGVREYWIVDPTARSVEVLTLTPDGLTTWRVFPDGAEFASPLLPGLTFPISSLFGT